MTRQPLFTSVLMLATGVLVAVNLHRPPAVAGIRESPPPILPVVKEPPAPAPDRRPATPAELSEALDRAFPDAAPFEDVRMNRVVHGDWNGDRSPDIVVPVRAAAARVAAINQELANWTIVDPDAPLPGTEAHPKVVIATVAAEERLLAVIHGLGPAGWRNPDARQAFLVKVEDGTTIELLPRKMRDFIYEARGHRFLYWTGGRYYWHTATGPVRAADSR